MTIKKPSKKLTDAEQVTLYMDNLQHPLKPAIEAMRTIIKNANPKIAERIKWNAPSYYYIQDIVTFGPFKDKVLLVFHHPLVVTIKSKLLEGDYTNRRLACFRDMKEVKESKKEIARIMNEIISGIDEETK